MRVLGHRGLTNGPAADANSLDAIARCFERGYGVETDVRDQNGVLVVAHDPPVGAVPGLADVLRLQASSRGGPVAINVKADGLQSRLARALAEHGGEYFVFDMSIPDALGYLDAGLRCFGRQSEHEPEPALYEHAAGVWLDCFESEWFDEAVVEGHLRAGKQVAVVSPELHGREHRSAWAMWREWPAFASDDVLICTDYPGECTAIFVGGRERPSDA